MYLPCLAWCCLRTTALSSTSLLGATLWLTSLVGEWAFLHHHKHTSGKQLTTATVMPKATYLAGHILVGELVIEGMQTASMTLT